MGEEEVLGYADGFKIGWDKCEEMIMKMIKESTMYAGTNNNGIDRKELLRRINQSHVDSYFTGKVTK